MSDLQTQMKQAVAEAAVAQIRDGMVVGLGSGSTAALMIQGLGARLAAGQLHDIVGVTTSFQGEVLAAELGIPLRALNAIDRIDLAIDGADEVDPSFQLIKGGGACHVQEKLVADRAERFIVVVDSTKLVQRLNLDFLLPVEVLPGAWVQVQSRLKSMGGVAELRMATRKAGPVVTDQGNLVLDVRFEAGISDPIALERDINNLPGVLENGLFVNLADEVLVGEINDGVVDLPIAEYPDGSVFTPEGLPSVGDVPDAEAMHAQECTGPFNEATAVRAAVTQEITQGGEVRTVSVGDARGIHDSEHTTHENASLDPTREA